MTHRTSTGDTLGWLLGRVPHARHAVVLSADGILMSASKTLEQEDGISGRPGPSSRVFTSPAASRLGSGGSAVHAPE